MNRCSFRRLIIGVCMNTDNRNRICTSRRKCWRMAAAGCSDKWSCRRLRPPHQIYLMEYTGWRKSRLTPDVQHVASHVKLLLHNSVWWWSWKWNSVLSWWEGWWGRQRACKSEIDASLAQQVAPKADIRPHMTKYSVMQARHYLVSVWNIFIEWMIRFGQCVSGLRRAMSAEKYIMRFFHCLNLLTYYSMEQSPSWEAKWSCS